MMTIKASAPAATNTCSGIVPADLFNTTTDVRPSTTCDNLVTTIPIAHHREQPPVMKSNVADSLAQALKSGEAPPVAKTAGEDYKRKGIVRTPPSVRAPPRTA